MPINFQSTYAYNYLQIYVLPTYKYRVLFVHYGDIFEVLQRNSYLLTSKLSFQCEVVVKQYLRALLAAQGVPATSMN